MKRFPALICLLAALSLIFSACILPPGGSFTRLMDRFDGTLTVGDFERVLGRHEAFDDIYLRELDHTGEATYMFRTKPAEYLSCTVSEGDLRTGFGVPKVTFDHVAGTDPSSERVTSVMVHYRSDPSEIAEILTHLRSLYGEAEEQGSTFYFRSDDSGVRVTAQTSTVSEDGEQGILLTWRTDAE